ncbi:hypothetical protein [Chitinophaga sp. sic0106]|uniref:hypothetical protein n=1 Tax=Chitinophaga sp. sic0106 TaxID=2854785 RepID=UPI001C4774A8|nr:hypothetical protein [Chitinophaga sp. sic0106]MBV7531147.1 hypothetical protein [Chitinophaga sp. sic0106]
MTTRNFKGVAGLILAAIIIGGLLVSGIPGSRKASHEKHAVRTATVEEVKEGSPGIIIHLKNDPKIYFINTKQHHQITAADLQQLSGKETQLVVADNWSPLDPFSSMQEIESIELNHHTIYSAH